jgi:hypothetical protein
MLAAIVSIISSIVTMFVNIVVLIVIIAIGFAIVTNKQRSQQQDALQTAAEQKENEQEENDEFGSLLAYISGSVVILIIWFIFFSILKNPDYESIHLLVIFMMFCLWLACEVLIFYVGDFRAWWIKHLVDEESNAKPPLYFLTLYFLIFMSIILLPLFLLIVVFVMMIRGGLW